MSIPTPLKLISATESHEYSQDVKEQGRNRRKQHQGSCNMFVRGKIQHDLGSFIKNVGTHETNHRKREDKPQ